MPISWELLGFAQFPQFPLPPPRATGIALVAVAEPARPDASDRTGHVRPLPQPLGSRINDAKSRNAAEPRNGPSI